MELSRIKNQITISECDKLQAKDGDGKSFSKLLTNLSDPQKEEEKSNEEYEVDETLMTLISNYWIPFSPSDEFNQMNLNQGQIIQNQTVNQVDSNEMQLKLEDLFNQKVSTGISKSLSLETALKLPQDLLVEMEVMAEPKSEYTKDLTVQASIESLTSIRAIIPNAIQKPINSHQTNMSAHEELMLENVNMAMPLSEDNQNEASLNRNSAQQKDFKLVNESNQPILSHLSTMSHQETTVESNTVMTSVKWENKMEVISQFYETAQTLSQNESRTIVLKLYPRTLGNVDVVLSMKDGVLSGKMTVSNPDVKEMMEKSLQQLISQFERNHVKVNAFEVNIQADSQSFDKQRDSQSRRSKKEQALKAVEKTDSNENSKFGSLKDLIASLI